MAAPTGAPVISEARFVNETLIYLSWRGLNEEDKNGPLTTYEVIKNLKITRQNHKI
jgi:hypothetical protein